MRLNQRSGKHYCKKLNLHTRGLIAHARPRDKSCTLSMICVIKRSFSSIENYDKNQKKTRHRKTKHNTKNKSKNDASKAQHEAWSTSQQIHGGGRAHGDDACVQPASMSVNTGHEGLCNPMASHAEWNHDLAESLDGRRRNLHHQGIQGHLRLLQARTHAPRTCV